MESSCDESALAVFDSDFGVRENLVHSQIDLHALYGGVVPDLASSEHLKKLPALVEQLSKSEYFKNIDLVAATSGPGLPNCLAMGISAASALSLITGSPLAGVNHLLGHAFSPFISVHAADPENFKKNFPALLPHLGLIVSGGNTILFEMDGEKRITTLAETVDDAAGEALDKGAKLLGMPYPGAPLLEELAAGGKADKSLFPYGQNRKIEEDPSFSFSGLKTSLKYRLQKLGGEPPRESIRDVCASYQFAVVEQLLRRSEYFARLKKYSSIGISGGVSNNGCLSGAFEKLAARVGAKFLAPERKYRGDNAAMIAFAAYADPESLSPSENKTLKLRSTWDL